MENQIELVGASMSALTGRLRAAAHNIANVNTTGYKRVHASFAGALAAQTGQPADAALTLDLTQGSLTRTGRPLDLALHGEGFFVIETPQGPLYTRNGTFAVNANRQLVDTSGRTVSGDSGPITLPPGVSPLDVTVSADGAVAAGAQQIGRLKLVAFADPSVLRPVGSSGFKSASPAAPAEAAETTVQQGHLEGSNVSAVEELVNLITITRLYQGNAKSIESKGDGMDYLLDVAMGS